MQQSLAQALELLHARIAEAVLGLPDKALHWQPAPEVDSVYDLIVRAADTEYRWMAEAVAGMPQAQPPTAAADAAAHPLFRLGDAGEFSQVVLAHVSVPDWTAARQVDGHTVSVARAVVQTLEELARTLGEIEVIVRLWKASGQ